MWFLKIIFSLHRSDWMAIFWSILMAVQTVCLYGLFLLEVVSTPAAIISSLLGMIAGYYITIYVDSSIPEVVYK